MPEDLLAMDYIGPIIKQEEVYCPPVMDYRVIPLTEKAIALTDTLTSEAISEGVNRRKRSGSRKMRKDVVLKLECCIRMILSNLVAELVIEQASAEVRISRSNRDKRSTRYVPRWFTVDICRLATELLRDGREALVTLKVGEYVAVKRSGDQSTLAPTQRLLGLAKGLFIRDFTHDKSHEVIVLKSRGSEEVCYWDRRPNGVRVEYSDTDFTNDARHKMNQINDYLSMADIRFNGAPLTALDRHLVRYFNEDFSRGGRLFKACWQNTSKAARHMYSINGSKCVEVDFKACNLYLAYASAGLSIGDCVKGDPYTFGGLGMSLKRKGIKTVMLAMLGASKPLKRFPDGTRKEMDAAKSLKFSDVEALIFKKHEAIAHLFYKGIGMKLQFRESEILVATLLELQRHNVVALPIHDCVVVAEKDQVVAKEVMLAVFFRLEGRNAVVEIEEYLNEAA